MVKLHLTDGQTLSFDLDDQDRSLEEWLNAPDAQARITAVTLIEKYDGKGVQFSLARPEGFRGQPWFEVERIEPNGRAKGGERLVLFVGDIRLAIVAHKSQPAARISVTQIGRRIGRRFANSGVGNGVSR